MKLSERINLLVALGEYIDQGSEALDAVIQQSYLHNGWFVPENSRKALASIRQAFLQREALEKWVANYSVQENTSDKTVGLILAGNIPLVGFHDVLAVFISGHRAKIKLSEKDKFLLPHLISKMAERDSRISAYLQITEKLNDFDAVIATGSDNTARYFEAYFGKYPNIIRRNRNGVAVLTGEETTEELQALGKDVFQYFGLGCRNVSKLYLPANYKFEPLLEAFHEYREIVLNNKYKNNFDYNYTLIIMNGMPHHSNGCILLTEAESLQSRIAQLHYEYFADADGLRSKLTAHRNDIQCIVSQPIEGVKTFPFGKAQEPALTDYADGEDTMAFLTALD
jgi:hypothetical protein